MLESIAKKAWTGPKQKDGIPLINYSDFRQYTIANHPKFLPLPTEEDMIKSYHMTLKIYFYTPYALYTVVFAAVFTSMMALAFISSKRKQNLDILKKGTPQQKRNHRIRMRGHSSPGNF